MWGTTKLQWFIAGILVCYELLKVAKKNGWLTKGQRAGPLTAREKRAFVVIATCAVAISKDGTNYTALWTETEPAGIAFDGTIHGINVYVPLGWKLKLTVTNATIGTTTYY